MTENRTLARVFEVLVIKAGGTGLAFAVAFMGSRYLGSEQVGLLIFGLGLVGVTTPVLSLGMPQLMLRKAAAAGRADVYGRSLRKALGITVFTALAAAVCIGLGQSVYLGALDKPGLAELIPSLTVILVCGLVINVLASSLHGRGFVRLSASVGPVIINAMACAAFLLFSPETAHQQTTYLAGINVIVAVALLLFAWVAYYRQKWALVGAGETETIRLRDGKYFWYNNTFRILSLHLPVVILGVMVPSAQLAYFSYANRCSGFVSLALISITDVTSPRIARFYAEGRKAELESLAKWSVKVSTAIAGPMVLLLYIFAEELLSIFGPDFVEGATALRILLLAELMNVVCGPVGYLLSLTGNEKVIFRINTASGLLVILLSPLAVHFHGILGVAVLLFLRMVVVNVSGSWFVKNRLGFVAGMVWKKEIV